MLWFIHFVLCLCRLDLHLQNRMSLHWNYSWHLTGHILQKLFQPSIDDLWVFLHFSCILTHFSCNITCWNMPKFVTMFTLVSACRTSKSLYMWAVITTFAASVFWTCMFFLILVKLFLFVWGILSLMYLSALDLNTPCFWRLSWFVSFILFSLELAWW